VTLAAKSGGPLSGLVVVDHAAGEEEAQAGDGRVGVVAGDAGISLFGVGPFFVHERHPAQPHFQTRPKPILWEVTFDAITLRPIRIHNQNGRRPKCVEAVEPGGMFFDVSFQRDKALMNEVGDFFVAV